MPYEREYSPLEHLGRSLLGARYCAESLFAMFAAYFDEAGGVDLGYMVVAGYVASVEAWEQFEINWKLFLAKFDVPYLHMKEFSHSKGCFSGWKDDEPRRVRFLAMAAEIINQHTKRAFESIVSYEDFESVDKLFALRERFNSPYALAGRTCIGVANGWARNPQTKALDIEYIFEDRGPDKSGLVKAVEALPPYLPTPAFHPSRDEQPTKNRPYARRGLVQLQAADYLAYEVRKVVYNVVHNKSRIPRKSLQALTGIELDRSSWTKERLLKICEGGNFERRQRNGKRI